MRTNNKAEGARVCGLVLRLCPLVVWVKWLLLLLLCVALYHRDRAKQGGPQCVRRFEVAISSELVCDVVPCMI